MFGITTELISIALAHGYHCQDSVDVCVTRISKMYSPHSNQKQRLGFAFQCSNLRGFRVTEQVKTLGTVLDSFGNLKTIIYPHASRHGRYTELHFNISESLAPKFLYQLDKSCLNRFTEESIAGCTSAEWDALTFKDPLDYTLLASHVTYHLPAGQFSDDSVAIGNLRAAMPTLGFKPKAMSAIFLHHPSWKSQIRPRFPLLRVYSLQFFIQPCNAYCPYGSFNPTGISIPGTDYPAYARYPYALTPLYLVEYFGNRSLLHPPGTLSLVYDSVGALVLLLCVLRMVLLMAVDLHIQATSRKTCFDHYHSSV
ncbi:hypothetical protein BDP27DRAFT_1367235 [Rhodocollybia butyracea]|uniref:Uncharacterized protein n=1 Tax=Rhodocollybia butyracea TaxID=206335 RepID=A0A9P5U459_9AGAR|nr:hypothetical protein BDP27DRAFT_1367235 [Rhodocollybia butyracea]